MPTNSPETPPLVVQSSKFLTFERAAHALVIGRRIRPDLWWSISNWRDQWLVVGRRRI